MDQATTTPYPQLVRVPTTPLYRLLKEKLGSCPVEYIHKRRGDTPQASYALIAHELRQLTKEYLTHEIPRRWYLYSTGATDSQ